MSTIEKRIRKFYRKPIPTHGKTIKEAYVKELKKLFDNISSGED